MADQWRADATVVDQSLVRLLVSPPPKSPPVRREEAGRAYPAQIDLSLERAAIAREQAHIEERLADRGRGQWPSDEAISAGLLNAEEASKARAVQEWVERGFSPEDSLAAVATCGDDTPAGLTFFQNLAKLRDEFGVESAVARTSLAANAGDMQAAVNQIFQSPPP